VLLAAVSGMLPKNNLRRARLRKLRVFAGPDHPFAANVAFVHPDAGTKGIRETMRTAVPVTH
jgi:ribosomal protein L13